MKMTLDELLANASMQTSEGFKGEIFNDYEKFDQSLNDKWTGKVIDNNDPDKLGRVKVLIYGVYDELSESALPWAIPDLGYIGGTNGNFIIPEVGTFLKGYFEHGDIQKPIFDSVAFTKDSVKNTTINSRINKSEDYPNKMVLLETDQGDYLTLNKKSGETEFHHRTGLNITIGADGSLTINTGESYDANGGLTINCAGTANINTYGDTNIHSTKGNIIVDSDFGEVQLGKNVAKQLINNLPNCVVTGMPHYAGNINVKC